MESLLTHFLLQKRYCPIPGIGTLRLVEGPCVVSHAEQKLSAPEYAIVLESKEQDAGSLITFLTNFQKVTVAQASEYLGNLSVSIRALSSDKSLPLPGAGHFGVNNNGKLIFVPIALPAEFLNHVSAERVIRPDQVQTIQVGDHITSTNQVVVERDSAEAPVIQTSWLLAVLLACIGVAIITWYITQYGVRDGFGNKTSLEMSTPPESTYQVR